MYWGILSEFLRNSKITEKSDTLQQKIRKVAENWF